MPENQYICDCNIIHHQAVEKAKKSMPEETELFYLADFLKILSDSTRCKIVFALFSGEMCVCDLANVLSMSKSSISHQLSKMKQGGVVKSRREGKEVYYCLDDEHVCEIVKNSLVHIRHRRGEEK
ncbi:MAG: ArsR/SmtB family transcription factor [Acutalibacteraceae bacterium]